MSPSTPTVSVVIPCRNYGRYLAEAIQSALAQTHPPAQVLVVDDGSTDETGEVVRRHGGTVDYLRLPFGGVCQARNAGLHKVTGQYVIFLDADDILDARYIEKTAALLESTKDPNVAFVYTQKEQFGDRQGYSRFPAYDSRILKQRNFIMVNALIRTEMARQAGFDPAFNQGLEDYDLFLTLAEKGFTGLLLDEPLVKVRVHDTSTTVAVNSTYRQIRLARQLIRKHAAFYTPSERRDALRAARQGLLLAIVENRRPDRPWRRRVVDLFQILRTPAGVLQLWTQLRYTFDPQLAKPLFRTNTPPEGKRP